MLEGVDKIDWSSLTHAYGPTTDVPNLLRGLASHDVETRENACYELCGNIWHQGTIYDATIPAIPFLFELLTHSGTPDRALVAHLLACIAVGRGYFEVHATGDWSDGHPWNTFFRERHTTLEAELRREAARVAELHQAVAPRLLLLAPYLTGPQEDLRECVVMAFANYPERGDETLPVLRSALETETDDHIREALHTTIRTLRRASASE